MRTDKEQAALILERYAQTEKEAKIKRKRLFASIASAACLVAVVSAVLVLPRLNAKVLPPPGNSSSQPDAAGQLAPGVFFNPVENTGRSDARLYFDPKETYQKELTDEEAFAFLGRDVRPKMLPGGLRYYGDADPEYRHLVVYNNDGTVCCDQFYFSYAEDFSDYVPTMRRLNVTASKTYGTRSDCYFLWEDEMRPSKINGTEVMLGAAEISYGPYADNEDGPNIPAGYYDLLIAEFQIKGVQFKVTGDSLSQEEFVSAIASMLE